MRRRSCGGGGGAPVTDADLSPSPDGEEIESHLDSVLAFYDTTISTRGGDLVICAGPGCNTLGIIFVSPATGGLAALDDTSGFDFVEEREGVFFAEKVSQWQLGNEREEYRTLAGWLHHTIFLVATRRGYNRDGYVSSAYFFGFDR